MSVWSLHIQASTTAASEAVFLTLLLFALDYLYRGIEEQRLGRWRSRPLQQPACALRYDGWMYAPLLMLAVAVSGKDRIASVTRAVLFGALAAAFPLWWMQTNEKATGDALYPIHYINQFHARWVQDGVAWLGPWGQRAMGSSSGRARSSPRPRCSSSGCSRSPAWCARCREAAPRPGPARARPAAYYTFRGAVRSTSPAGRFFMVQVALALFS
jgi:hypothetical protein